MASILETLLAFLPALARPSRQADEVKDYAKALPQELRNTVSTAGSLFGFTGAAFAGSKFFNILPYNPDDMVQKKGIKMYRTMLTDEQIKAALLAKKYAVLSTGYEIMMPALPKEDANDESGEDVEAAQEAAEEHKEFVEFNLQEMTGAFDSKILGIMTALEFGFCLHGDTLIHTPSGDVPIKNLVGQQPWVFSKVGDELKLARASKVWRTKQNAPCVRVNYEWFTNGGKRRRGSITCTAEHPFMLLDGSYRQAGSLTPGDRLAPYSDKISNNRSYIQTRYGYGKTVWSKRAPWVISQFSDAQISGNDQVHHKDENTVKDESTGRFVSIQNHKVVSVEVCGNFDVYDMEVPGTHNFAANHVFVHNSVSETLFWAIDYGPFNGKWGLKDIKTRPQEDIDFAMTIDGDLQEQGVLQLGKPLPAAKFVIYSYHKECDNPYGRSDLRAAYKSWWCKDVLFRLMPVAIERYGEPIAVASYTGTITQEQRDAVNAFIRNLQSRSGILIPDNIKIDFRDPSTGTGEAFMPALNLCDQYLRVAVLMPGLLGLSAEQQTGSFARAVKEFDVFMWILGQLRKDLETVINEQLIKPLLDLNYTIEHGQYPRFAFKEVTEEIKQKQFELFLMGLGGGALRVGPDDENRLRDLIGFEPLPEETLVEVPEPEGLGGGGLQPGQQGAPLEAPSLDNVEENGEQQFSSDNEAELIAYIQELRDDR